MAYRDQVAALEHRALLAEKRAARAEARAPRRSRVLMAVGALLLSATAATMGYALSPPGDMTTVLIDGHEESVGPLRQSTWRATRGDDECHLVTDDLESRHRAALPRRLVLRLYCGEELLYETPQLRLGERHIGGCISRTGRSLFDHRLFCSERVVDRRGRQRGPALSADSEGHILQLTDDTGEVQEWHLQSRPYERVSVRVGPTSRTDQEVTLHATASIRELEGSPMVHGVEVPLITGRSTCDVSVRSTLSLGLDTQCEMRVECDGVPLYTDEGHCFHSAGALRTFADYEATGDSQHVGRRTPVAVYDGAVGILRLADQDRERGFSMTLELQRPSATVAGIF